MSDNPFTLDERYTSATVTSNLRVEADKRGAGDVLIAFGWSASRIGAALLRLHSEWDGVSRTKHIGKDAIERLSWEMGRQPSEKECSDRYEALVKKNVSPADAMRLASATIPDRAAAKKAADDWYQHEMKLAMQRLKSLPEVRAQVVRQAWAWNVDDAEHVAASVLLWWMDKTCKVCNGTQEQIAKDSHRHIGKACQACGGTGEIRVPRGQDGRRLANWLDMCSQLGRTSIAKRLRP